MCCGSPGEAIMAGSQAKGNRTLVVRCGARDWAIEVAESAGFPLCCIRNTILLMGRRE
jgi:hypothetical protein